MNAVLRYRHEAPPCPVTAKVSYRTRRKALIASEKFFKDNKRLRLYAYRCPEPGCGHWHLTRQIQTSRSAVAA